MILPSKTILPYVFSKMLMTENMTPRYTTTTTCKDIHAGKLEMKTGGPVIWEDYDELLKGLKELYDRRLDEATLDLAIAEVNASSTTTSVMSGLQGFLQPQAIKLTENANAGTVRAEKLEALVRSDLIRAIPPCTQKGVMDGVTASEMKPFLRLHGIFLENADYKLTAYAYMRILRDWVLGAQDLEEALSFGSFVPRGATEPWPFPSFMGPHCSADRSRRMGVLDPQMNIMASVESAMLAEEAEEDEQAGSALVTMSKMELRAQIVKPLLARTDELIKGLVAYKKSKSVSGITEKTRQLQREEITPKAYSDFLEEAESKLEEIQLQWEEGLRRKSRVKESKAAKKKVSKVPGEGQAFKEAAGVLTAKDLNAVSLVMGAKVDGKVRFLPDLEVSGRSLGRSVSGAARSFCRCLNS